MFLQGNINKNMKLSAEDMFEIEKRKYTKLRVRFQDLINIIKKKLQ